MYLAQSTNWGHFPDHEMAFRSFWFLRREENRSTRRKTSRNKNKKQQQTQPTSQWWGGKCSHHCASTPSLPYSPSMAFLKFTSLHLMYYLEKVVDDDDDDCSCAFPQFPPFLNSLPVFAHNNIRASTGSS